MGEDGGQGACEWMVQREKKRLDGYVEAVKEGGGTAAVCVCGVSQ